MKEEINQFLAAHFPQNKGIVEQVGNRGATVRLPVGLDELRPGGTVSARH